jgi:hypothetical protein
MTPTIFIADAAAGPRLRHLVSRIRKMLDAPGPTSTPDACLDALPGLLRADIGLPPQAEPPAAAIPPLCLWRA